MCPDTHAHLYHIHPHPIHLNTHTHHPYWHEYFLAHFLHQEMTSSHKKSTETLPRRSHKQTHCVTKKNVLTHTHTHTLCHEGRCTHPHTRTHTNELDREWVGGRQLSCYTSLFHHQHHSLTTTTTNTTYPPQVFKDRPCNSCVPAQLLPSYSLTHLITCTLTWACGGPTVNIVLFTCQSRRGQRL